MEKLDYLLNLLMVASGVYLLASLLAYTVA